MPTTKTEAPQQVVQASAQVVEKPAHEEPISGGNYVRDPITGALRANPAFEETQE
jgi:hypothetical protein